MGLLTLVVLGGIGLAILLAAGLVVGLVKLAFRLLVLPFVLLGGFLKVGLALTVGLVLLLVAAPVLLGVALVVLLPLLLFGGLVWGAVKLAQA